jgi:hypothetical protein
VLVATNDATALFANGRWSRLPATGLEAPQTIVAVGRSDALIDDRVRLVRSTGRWLAAPAPTRGAHATVALDDGRIALIGGCSDTGECWGDPEIDVYDPATNRYAQVELGLQREHSIDPAGVAVGGDRLLMTSTFGGGRNIEHCRLASDVATTPPCACGACDVAERDRFAVVRDGACLLVVGGVIDHEPVRDVLRYCWP